MQPLTHASTRTDLIRRAAYALPLAQLTVGAIGSGVVVWLVGTRAALAFLVGAIVIAAGYAVFGWRTGLRSPVVPAGQVLFRLLLGALLKWLVIGAGLALAMAVAGLPAEFVLAGALGALLAYLICIPWLLR